MSREGNDVVRTLYRKKDEPARIRNDDVRDREIVKWPCPNRNITPLLSLKSPRLQLSLSRGSRRHQLRGHWPSPRRPLPRTCEFSRTPLVHVPNISRILRTWGSRSRCARACRGDTSHTSYSHVRLYRCEPPCLPTTPPQAC